MTRITGTLREDQHTFMINLAQLLEREMFQSKLVEKAERTFYFQ
jgi:hypothetical protein